MKNTKNILVVGIFALIIFGFGIWGLVAGDNKYSMTERRNLAQFPKFSWETANNGEFMTAFETYTLDQFPLRDSLRTLKAISTYYVFRQKDNNSLYIQKGYASKLEYPLSEDSLEYAAVCFDVVYNKLLAGKEVNIYGVIVPDKNYYLAEAGGYPSMDYERLYNFMEERLPYINYIDVRDLLSYDDYYKTDTHWRQERIVDVANRILMTTGAGDVASQDNKLSSSVITVDDFTTVEVTNPFYGVYYGQAALPIPAETLYYLTNDTLNACTVKDFETNKTIGIYDLDKADGADLYEIFLSGSKSLLEINNPNALTDRELVIFRDSFGSSITPLLVEQYSKVTVVDIRYISIGYLARLLEINNQDIIFLYSTLVLNNSVTLKQQ